MRKAFIGDIHGALPELEKLWHMLQHYSLDAIEHCGDLVDRGPDPGGVLQFCRERKIHGVMGNHDSVIMQYLENGKIPKNPDKAKSREAILKDPANVEYLKSLPYHKIHDDKLLQVHAGVSPFLPLQQQPDIMFCTASLVNPDDRYKVKWMHVDRKGIPEEEHRKNGWVRWYEPYWQPYDLVFGHVTFKDGQAWKYKAQNGHHIYGVDTGGWFTKNLTALIYPDEIFVSTTLGEYRL